MKTTNPQHRLIPLLSLPVFLFLVIPTLIVVPVALNDSRYITFPPEGLSFAAVAGFFADTAWTSALAASLQSAGIAVVIGVAIGSTAAIALHGRTFPGKSAVMGLILAPMIVPTVVLALAFYQFFISVGMVGSIIPIGLAHAVIATPYVYLTTRASLAGLNPALVRSAQSLGAGTLSVFRHVYLPVILPGLVSGALFAFSVSIDETVMSLFMQSPSATTLPVKMFTDIQFNLTPKIAVSSALLVTVATIGLLLQVMFVLKRRSISRMVPLAVSAQT
ncbi:polyamine ABC transporter permease [Arthrobacter sp. StoSoilA2]|uniref:ABC transporter permease n=1 Tax=unclassified Arthrobacter TaxID=235627 RepID=UPI001CC4BEB0|nr:MULTISPECIES: ABC transporter permease [unclassified Arthrobacter]MDR6687858.1 putative spermidine/putrescine transport system permease protein [Arthrobacter sp. 1088]BCW34567.1 polyamine ABC transporter permease [Arthrobacter sp. StoSoilA2]BCW52311.1 polyamine ABC transporter permease [Arthrobacter sp. StoSoilB13]